MRRDEQRFGYLMVSPAVILLAALIGYPLVFSLFLSLTDKMVGRPGHYIGVQNFVQLITTDEIFRIAVLNTLIYTVISVTLKLVLGLLLAVILFQIRRGRKLFRGLVMIPWATPMAVAGIAWMWMYEPMFSIINLSLIGLGLSKTGIPWLIDPVWARVSIIITNVWRGLPFFSITFLAALMAIPVDLIESAKIDGAGSIRRFFSIIIPLAAPLLMVVTLFSIVMTVADFDIVWTLTKGGPLNQTHVFGTLAYVRGLMAGELGRGAAITLFILPFLAVVSYFQLRQVSGRLE